MTKHHPLPAEDRQRLSRDDLTAPDQWYWIVERSGRWKLHSGQPRPPGAVDLERPETWPLPVRIRRRWTHDLALLLAAVLLGLFSIPFWLSPTENGLDSYAVALLLVVAAGCLFSAAIPGLPLYRGHSLVLDREGLQVKGPGGSRKLPWPAYMDGHWWPTILPLEHLGPGDADPGRMALIRHGIRLKRFVGSLAHPLADLALLDLIRRFRVLAGAAPFNNDERNLRPWKMAADGHLVFDPENRMSGVQLQKLDLEPGAGPLRIESPPVARAVIANDTMAFAGGGLILGMFAVLLPATKHGWSAVSISTFVAFGIAGGVVAGLGRLVWWWRANRGLRRVVMGDDGLTLVAGTWSLHVPNQELKSLVWTAHHDRALPPGELEHRSATMLVDTWIGHRLRFLQKSEEGAEPLRD